MSTKLTVAAVTSIELGLVTVRLSPVKPQRVNAHAGRLLRKVHRANRGSHDPLGVADHAEHAGCRGRDANHALGGVETSGSGRRARGPYRFDIEDMCGYAHSIARRRARIHRRTEPPDHGNEPVDRGRQPGWNWPVRRCPTRFSRPFIAFRAVRRWPSRCEFSRNCRTNRLPPRWTAPRGPPENTLNALYVNSGSCWQSTTPVESQGANDEHARRQRHREPTPRVCL